MNYRLTAREIFELLDATIFDSLLLIIIRISVFWAFLN